MRLIATVLVAVTLAASAFTAQTPTRIVAVADVHGGFQPFVAILTAAGLIDAQQRWTGGRTIFVQTGDVTDRGTGVSEALDLLMTLEKEAAAAGGKVHVLLGNHEVMNMLGDTRDVSPDVLTAFGGEAGYRAAFGRDGKYGKWLRTKPILLNLDGTVFMHAGINLDFSTETLDQINRRVRREITEWDEGQRWLEQQNRIKPSAGVSGSHHRGAVRDRAGQRDHGGKETSRAGSPPWRRGGSAAGEHRCIESLRWQWSPVVPRLRFMD